MSKMRLPQTRLPKTGISNLKKLGPRHLLAIDLILSGLPVHEALAKTGYSAKSTKQMARLFMQSELVIAELELRREKVTAVTSREVQKVLAEAGVDGPRTVKELAAVVLFDPRRLFNENNDLIDIKDWPDDVASAVASIEVEQRSRGSGKDIEFYMVKKVKMHPKVTAIGLMLEHLGIAKPPTKTPTTGNSLHIHMHELMGALPPQVRAGSLTIDMEPPG